MLSLTSPSGSECTDTLPLVKTLGFFLEEWCVEQCSAVAPGWCWNPIFLLVFWCVSTFGACSGSAALETVFFDFCQACLTHFWGCCVASLSITHSCMKNPPLSVAWPPYRLSLVQCSLIISPCAFPMDKWIWTWADLSRFWFWVWPALIFCYLQFSPSCWRKLQQSGSWSADFEF